MFLSPSFQLLSDLGFTKDWKEARQKLLATIPKTLQKDANDIWNRIHIDTDTWRQSSEELNALGILQEAIWDERKIQMEYERGDHEIHERIVEPLGLVAKGRTWYLIAVSNEKIKNYRVSRVKSAEMTNDRFIRPPEFNLVDYWQESKQAFIKSLQKFEVDVEISPSIIQRIKFTGRFVQVLHVESKKENGWIPANLCFDTEQEAKEYVLGFSN